MTNIYEETDLKLESEKQLKNCEDMHIWVKPIKDYIKELEAKEERAKKVEELLGLYQGLRKTKSVFHVASIFENAKALEKELEEMK